MIEISERLKWIEHEGSIILRIDYREMEPNEMISFIDDFVVPASGQFPQEGLVLVTVNGLRSTSQSLDALVGVHSRIRGKMKKGVFVGANRVQQMLFSRLTAARNKSYLMMYDESDALRWLAEQS